MHKQTMRSLYDLKEIAVIGVLTLAFFLLIGMALYPVETTSQGRFHFDTTHNRLMELIFMTLGSVNFPNVMLPALTADGNAALIYFYPYLYFSVFIYLNILLAVVYNSYTSNARETLEALQAKRQLLIPPEEVCVSSPLLHLLKT